MALMLVAVPFFVLPIQRQLAGEVRYGMLSNLVLIFIGLLVLGLNRSGRTTMGSLLLCFSLWATDLVLAAFLGDAGHAVLGGFLVVVMMAGLLLGGRSALAAAVLSVLSCCGLLVAERADLLYPLLPPMNSARVTWLIHVPHVVFCAFVISQFVRRNHEALAKALAGAQAEAEARQAIEAMTKARSAFLANVSHELRTPLSVIVGATELMGLASPPPKLAKHVFSVRNAADSLGRLVEDILDTTAIKAGVMTIRSAPFRVDEVIEAVIGRHRSAADAKGLVMSVEVDPALATPLVGDRERLIQVVSNLVGNAVKYTERGSVSFTASGVVSGGQMHLDFLVADTGPGISGEFLQVIFEPFTRARVDGSGGPGGMGLGLPITKSLVDAMGGELLVESEVGRGSTFRCRLALVLVERAQVVELESGGQPATGPSVLVVDDVDMVRDILVGMLEFCGCEVAQAEGGEQAVALFNQRSFDLVFMDLEMPTMDGFTAARAIRQATNGADCPILAVSAQSVSGTLERCHGAGMFGLVVKPVSLSEVQRIVAGHTGARRPQVR